MRQFSTPVNKNLILALFVLLLSPHLSSLLSQYRANIDFVAYMSDFQQQENFGKIDCTAQGDTDIVSVPMGLNTTELHLLARRSTTIQSSAYFTEIFHRRGDSSSLYFAGRLHEECGDHETALVLWRLVRGIDQFFLRQYRDAVRVGDLHSALPPLNTLTELFPQEATYWKLLGDTYSSLGEYEQSAAQYEVAVDLLPDNPRYAYDLGSAYMRIGSYAQAAEILPVATQSMTLDTRVRFFAYLALGRSQYALGESVQACNAIADSISLGEQTSISLQNNNDLCRQDWVQTTCDAGLRELHSSLCSR